MYSETCLKFLLWPPLSINASHLNLSQNNCSMLCHGRYVVTIGSFIVFKYNGHVVCDSLYVISLYVIVCVYIYSWIGTKQLRRRRISWKVPRWKQRSTLLCRRIYHWNNINCMDVIKKSVYNWKRKQWRKRWQWKKSLKKLKNVAKKVKLRERQRWKRKGSLLSESYLWLIVFL